MRDGPGRLVIFDVADRIERIAVEELRPVGMRHRACLAARLGDFRENVRLGDTLAELVRADAVDLRRDAGMDRGIAAGRGRRQHRAHAPFAGLARLDPAFQIAHERLPVPPRQAVEDDEQKLGAGRHEESSPPLKQFTRDSKGGRSAVQTDSSGLNREKPAQPLTPRKDPPDRMDYAEMSMTPQSPAAEPKTMRRSALSHIIAVIAPLPGRRSSTSLPSAKRAASTMPSS